MNDRDSTIKGKKKQNKTGKTDMAVKWRIMDIQPTLSWAHSIATHLCQV